MQCVESNVIQAETVTPDKVVPQFCPSSVLWKVVTEISPVYTDISFIRVDVFGIMSQIHAIHSNLYHHA